MSNIAVWPKGNITLLGNIKCPHCSVCTNGSYQWHPALSCWSCGKDMWLDDHGRSIAQRGELSRAGVTIEDSVSDRIRISRIPT